MNFGEVNEGQSFTCFVPVAVLNLTPKIFRFTYPKNLIPLQVAVIGIVLADTMLFSLTYEPIICRWAWHAVASWTWDAQDEMCGICRLVFDGCCPDCKHPGDDCPIIWGQCNHAFHLHCILKWVNSQTPQAHCPLCRREWQFKG
ncbi:hypothetical protein V2J09_011203 [Rumex salicifolius]